MKHCSHTCLCFSALAGVDLEIVRRGFFVVQTSHYSSVNIKGWGCISLSMLTENGEDLSVVSKMLLMSERAKSSREIPALASIGIFSQGGY